MRLYGALSELAELIIRLASGKTVKISAENQPSGGTDKVVSIPDMGASDADELVLKDLEQTLTKKTLQGSTTADGEGNLTSDSVISTVDVAASTLQMPVVSNSNDRPQDQRKAGALTLAAGEVHVGQGDGTFKSLADLSSSQVMTNKTISSSSFQGQINNTTLGGSSDIQILGISTLDISNLTTSGNDHVVITNANGEVETEAALAKVRGGIGADATNIIFPASGTLVTEAGAQTLSNKTIGAVTAENGLLSISGVGALKIPAGTQAERPASPVEGMMRYNSETDSFEGYASNTWSGIGGGGTVDRIAQVGHSFVLGDVLYLNGSTYVKASAAADNTAEVVGIVSRVIDADNFEMTLSGEVAGLSGLTPGAVYFLSATTAGALTTTEPSVVGQVSLPVGVASSATSLYVAPKRGVVVGAANLRTQIGLDGDPLLVRTTNIQKITSYDAGELAGWVELNATTDYKFYVQAQFVKNAAGVWNLSYQTTGDTPPAGFSMDVNDSTEDFIEVTLPAMAGFVDGKINFALNAPAVGTSLPLSVDASNLVSGTIDSARLPLATGSSAGAIPFYEEGTWTPGITFGGNSVGVSYGANRFGHYTRIGNRCFFHCYVVLASRGSSTGPLNITGLPFTVANTANGGATSVAIWVSGISVNGGMPIGYTINSSTRIDVNYIPVNQNAGGANQLLDGFVSNTASFMVSGSYIIA